MFYNHDSASTFTSSVAGTKDYTIVAACMIPHLATSDFSVPKSEEIVHFKYGGSAETSDYLEELEKLHYTEGIKKLEIC